MPRIYLKSSDKNYDYALEVLSYYIWGAERKPGNIADESLADKSEEIVLEFSTKDYLEKFFHIKDTSEIKKLATKFGLFNTFFNSNGKTRFGENLDYELLEQRAKPFHQYFASNSCLSDLQVCREVFIASWLLVRVSAHKTHSHKAWD
ncbi:MULTISPECIES: hypothetical protein [unclassified Campylobacter]|uniref:hypothetical protein n=1 Tax=unclassified Campylobacter TaxID=2593542 RepID=UPI0022E99D12|nr:MULTISPECIES: hypothetical protein [unclassified Campylobacter]MDA3062671.1 hypothetical protein [Campylobacter sp. JMF_14 EL1]MDA3074028.1 hypothetical protein [Campylobacter sp. JMF_10 EL2]